MNLPVYSSDRKKLGFLRHVTGEHIVVKRGLVSLSNYLIPKATVESVDKRGLRLGVTAYDARRKFAYARMKNLAVTGSIPKSLVRDRAVRDRLLTLRHSTTRNRLAAAIAFVSGSLFILSGYKANIAIFSLVREQLVVHTAREFWSLAIVPIGFLALLSQLGGFTVMMGAALFAANRITIGKALVMLGTGQGIFTILLRLGAELWSGRLDLDNNYVTWLTTSATGLGLLFAVIAQSLSKGNKPSLARRAAKWLFRK